MTITLQLVIDFVLMMMKVFGGDEGLWW